MGIFNINFGKPKQATTSTPGPTPAPAKTSPQPPPKASPQPPPKTATQPPAKTSPQPPPKTPSQSAPPVVSEPAKQAAAPVAAPKVQLRGSKWLFLPSLEDPSKVAYYFKAIVHYVNYELHHEDPNVKLQGRVGMHSDKKKIHIEVKGNPKDIEKFLTWIKLDHSGMHPKNSYMEKYSMDGMSHSGLFAKKEGTMS